ncbi:MAG TPA: hypothetical protein PLQ56_22295 [Aggregatilineales bacterium]|nr:hypothetical protein [Aggregatilineales bacterium]
MSDLSPGTAEHQPHFGVLWRGYDVCAERILTGYGWIANELNRSGWPFRDRWGKPRPFALDDVRRVVSNWREYAGLVTPGKVGKVRDRIASKIENSTAVLQDTVRAVFYWLMWHGCRNAAASSHGQPVRGTAALLPAVLCDLLCSLR